MSAVKKIKTASTNMNVLPFAYLFAFILFHSYGSQPMAANAFTFQSVHSHTYLQSRYISKDRSNTQLQMVATKSGGRAIESEQQFQVEVLHSDIEEASLEPVTKPTLVFFTAPWCGPCRLSNPIVKEIIKEFVPKIDVVEVCTDDFPELAEEAGIVSIPTIQIYNNGEVLDTIVGCVAKNVLANAVSKVLEDLGLDDESTDEKTTETDE